jgi:hypothetical protein
MNVDSSCLLSEDMAPAVAAPITGTGTTAVRTAFTAATVTDAIGAWAFPVRSGLLSFSPSLVFISRLAFSNEQGVVKRMWGEWLYCFYHPKYVRVDVKCDGCGFSGARSPLLRRSVHCHNFSIATLAVVQNSIN